MYHVLLIALKDLYKSIKNFKRILLITIICIISITFISNGLQFLFKEGIYINKVDIIIVNQDTHPVANLLLNQVSEDENIKSIMNLHMYEDINAAEESVKDNLVTAAIVIPRGFVNSLEVGRNYPVQLITNNANPVISQIIESLLDSYMKSVSAGQSAVNAVWDYYGKTGMSYEEKSRKIDSVINDITFRVYLARNNIIENEDVLSLNTISSGQFYLFSILLISTMFIAITGAKEVIFERKHLVFQRLRLGGINEVKYLLGKFIYLFLKILTESSIVIIIAAFILSSGIQMELFLLILLFILVIIAIISLGLFGSIIINSEEKYITIGNTVVLIMAIIGGSIIPTIYLPYNISIFSRYTINYWAVSGFIGLFTNQLQETYISIIILSSISFIFMFAAIGLFRYKGRKGM